MANLHNSQEKVHRYPLTAGILENGEMEKWFGVISKEADDPVFQHFPNVPFTIFPIVGER